MKKTIYTKPDNSLIVLISEQEVFNTSNFSCPEVPETEDVWE